MLDFKFLTAYVMVLPSTGRDTQSVGVDYEGGCQRFKELQVLGKKNRLLFYHYILSLYYDTDYLENVTSNNSSTVA